MAVTRLKRKDRRNKARATNRINRIKQLTRKPVIKNLENEDQAAAAQQPADKSEKTQVQAKEVSTSDEEE
jgi:hypothetical protein